jgi:hypothetical protein
MNDRRLTPNEGTWWALMGVAIIVIVIVRVIWASHVYNDWTCAFANCAKVTVEK